MSVLYKARSWLDQVAHPLTLSFSAGVSEGAYCQFTFGEVE